MAIPAILQEGLRLPVIAAPMFLISSPRLVIETCKQGLIGTLPALNARPAAKFDDWLYEIEAALSGQGAAKYGAMLVMHSTNKRLEQDLDTVVRHKVPLVITAVGLRADVIKEIHAYGGVVFHDAIHMKHAMKAAEAGVDGIIPICAGGGGHSGALNPFTFVSQLRACYDGAIILGGALGNGREVRAAEVLGADFAYMGTRFIPTPEAHAVAEYKQAVVDSKAADIIRTTCFTGLPANFMRSSILSQGLDPDNLPTKEKDFTHEAAGKPVKAWKDVWSAGQGVGSIDAVEPVADIIARLKAEYADAKQRIAAL